MRAKERGAAGFRGCSPRPPTPGASGGAGRGPLRDGPYLPLRCPAVPSSEAAMVPAAGRGRPFRAAAARPSLSAGNCCPPGGPRRRSQTRPRRWEEQRPLGPGPGPGRHLGLGRNSPTCSGRRGSSAHGRRPARGQAGARGGPGAARSRPSPSLSVSPPHAPPRWSRPGAADSAPSRLGRARRHSNGGARRPAGGGGAGRRRGRELPPPERPRRVGGSRPACGPRCPTSRIQN